MRKIPLILIVILWFTSCGGGLSKEQLSDYGEIAYSDMISYIAIGYQTKWKDMNPREMNLSPMYRQMSSYAGFSIEDINGDGRRELLLGEEFPNGEYVLYDICCFSGKDASFIHLKCGGKTDYFQINTDGIIIESISTSGSAQKGFRLKDDKLIEVDTWTNNLRRIHLEKFSQLDTVLLYNQDTDGNEPK